MSLSVPLFVPCPMLYLRAEDYEHEHRTPLVPMDVGRLVQNGVVVYIQSSTGQRVYSDDAYAAVGAKITTLPWHDDLFRDALVVGLKTLPSIDRLCGHRHLYFSHAFRGQSLDQVRHEDQGLRQSLHQVRCEDQGLRQSLDQVRHEDQGQTNTIIQTFRQTSSTLYDFEYMVDETGHRLLAFGHYAGIVGAGLGLLQYFARISEDTYICKLQSWTDAADYEQDMRAVADCLRLTQPPRIAVLGPRGRCGRAVCEFLDTMGFPYVGLDKHDSKTDLLDRFDIVYNCVLLATDQEEVWITADQAEAQIDHKVIVDISCDVTKRNNPFRELYQDVGTWTQPVQVVAPFVDALVLDNLPSLLPKSSSIAFSGTLTDLLLSKDDGPWARARAEFERVGHM